KIKRKTFWLRQTEIHLPHTHWVVILHAPWEGVFLDKMIKNTYNKYPIHHIRLNLIKTKRNVLVTYLGHPFIFTHLKT
ncbi:hypothetical protein COE33_29740, partial [Bacillus anthracis]